LNRRIHGQHGGGTSRYTALVWVKKEHRVSSIPSSGRHVGLARALSKLGLSSRSWAVQWIREGKVSVNGSVVKNPEAPVRLGKDRVEVEGRQVFAAEKLYLMLSNSPLEWTILPGARNRELGESTRAEESRDSGISRMEDAFPLVLELARAVDRRVFRYRLVPEVVAEPIEVGLRQSEHRFRFVDAVSETGVENHSRLDGLIL
jgi:hypothetical protein